MTALAHLVDDAEAPAAPAAIGVAGLVVELALGVDEDVGKRAIGHAPGGGDQLVAGGVAQGPSRIEASRCLPTIG